MRKKQTRPPSKLNRNGLPLGTVAPEFCLPLATGGEVKLGDFLGRRVLLVFSDPHCGPCTALSPHLEVLHRARSDFEILMISRGDIEANLAKIEELNLTFPVVLQRQWEISRDYGMFATPMAYLIGEDGVIMADAAVGMDPILALVNREGKEQCADALQIRLTALRKEMETGQLESERVDKERVYLLETMFRISGAILVLEELLATPGFANSASASSSERSPR